MCIRDRYGYGGSTGYILFNSDASKSFTLEDEDGMYYKVIEMFYKANQMGILDPDSSTQSFDELTAKVKDGAAFSSPFPITEYNLSLIHISFWTRQRNIRR